MISKELEADILRLYHAERWRVGTIASQLGVHHSTVRRVLARAGLIDPVRSKRPSMIEPFLAFVREVLGRYPRLRASRLYEMVRERGYRGHPDHFRHLVARLRPRPPAEAYLKLRTLPGEQAQVDWAHFGTARIGRAERAILAFVMVLSFSRRLFVRFFLDQRMANFLRGHVAAFEEYGGLARVLLYDDREQIEELFELGFITEAGNVILAGPNGVGKTMIAKNLAHHALLVGHTARFITTSALLNDLAAQNGGGALERRLRHYERPRILVLDELGYLPCGTHHADLLFEIVSRRYQEKPIVLTTNKPFAEWNEVFPNTSCVVALVDRLVHRAEIVNIEGESFRWREAKERTEQRARERAERRRGRVPPSGKTHTARTGGSKS